ncbi:hypothetical protein [Geobacter sp.]|uniref:hypothetical protein n=1 Tax=Geobacter sp. TaxID=46610 RepID=UPI002634CEC4|nr:hypothetical protein [Geobacter sp.]
MADITKRMNFFDRQFLRARDFQDEQAYHIDRRRRHGGGLHGSGVVEGLTVSAGGGVGQVTVDRGWALDPLGREIVLAAPRANIATGGVDVAVWIAYPDPEPLANPSSDPGVTGLTRVNEGPVVTIVPPGTQPANGILLATVTAGGVINNGVRALAGVKDRSITEPKLADGAVSTRAIQDGSVSSVKLQSAASDAQDAQRAVTANHIRNRSVTEPKLADGAVSTRTIQDKAVTADKLLDGSVATVKLADDAVTQAKIAPKSVSIQELKASIAAEGTLVLAGSTAQLVPPSPLAAGFYMANITITDQPQVGVDLRIACQEEYTATMRFIPRPPPLPPITLPIVGRQWRVTNQSANQLNVAYRIYRIEET